MNVSPKKKSVILCIDPNSDSDIVIEEGDEDFKERCIIIKKEKEKAKEEAEQVDNEQSEQLTETATESESEPKDETISSTSTQDFNQEKVKREFINLTSHYKQIRESFGKLVEEVLHMKKCQLATHLVKMPILPMVKVTMEKKVSSMYGQKYHTTICLRSLRRI